VVLDLPVVRLPRPMVVTSPRQWRTRLDPALVILLCLLDLVVSWDRRGGGVLPEWATPGYAAVGYLALLWRRRFPVLVLLVVAAHSMLAWVVEPGYVPSLGLWLALGTVAFYCDRRAALLGLLVALAPTALNAADEMRRAAPDDHINALVVATVLGTLVDLAAFGVGRWAAWTVRNRRLAAARAAADAVAAERLRVAADLHDIVAHAVSLMVLQSAGAARVLRNDPERAEEALRNVAELGQQAIVELRRMLGLLASGASIPDRSAGPSIPGLQDVGVLLERARAGGLRTEFDVTGEPVPLDPGVDLSAYRIVQEALTNSARYADPDLPVRVEMHWHPTEIQIRVSDRSPPVDRRPSRHPLSTGHGLIGMRQRATAVGGSFRAGPRPDGGFLVAASFPVDRRPSATSERTATGQLPHEAAELEP